MERDYQTIRTVARSYGLAESFLRRMEAQGQLPGVYSGNTKLVNVPMLLKKLNDESERCGRTER